MSINNEQFIYKKVKVLNQSNEIDYRNKKNKSMKKNIIYIKNVCPYYNDPRLLKLIDMLDLNEYNVTFIGWNKNGVHNQYKSDSKIKSIIFNGTSSYTDSYMYFALWWIFILFHLIKLEYDIVHVINFPSIYPALLVSKIKKKKIIYDILDTSADQIITSRFLRELLLLLERIPMRFVDYVILADDFQKMEFRKIPNKNCCIIYDAPKSINIELINKNSNNFKIFFSGVLYKKRNLNIENICKAIEHIKNIELTIVGDGDLKEDIKIWKNIYNININYISSMIYSEVLKKSLEADLLFSLRDKKPLVNTFICGSKFLESIMLGKPILVNDGTSAAIRVLKHKCGLIVDANNISEIEAAIKYIKENPDVCKLLGTNGKNAYKLYYDWQIMKQRLITLYQELTERA